jgi:tRNA-2-methylthio-N6-dimethylallyladenosine synthase
MSGRAHDGRLVHFAPGGRQVRPGDIVATTVTDAAPHHLIADGAVITHRRTRAGDAYAAGQRPGRLLSLGMPGIGQPAATAESLGCTR